MTEHNHDENCGCEEMVFNVTDDDGIEHEMVLAETFEVSDKTYAVLLDRHDLEADAVILRLEEQDEELVLSSIDDEAEWNTVIEAYNALVEEDEQNI